MNKESRALQVLLSLDDSPQAPRYKQQHTEPSQGPRNPSKLTLKSDKENQPQRILPKLNTSKEELKLILRRLEEPEIALKTVNRTADLVPLQECRSHTQALKSNRAARPGVSGRCGVKEGNRSILQVGIGDDIRTLMRQNNYSANALNLKTMHILQQLSSKQGVNPKPRQSSLGRKNLVAFLKRVA